MLSAEHRTSVTVRTTATAAIETIGLTKTYGARTVVDGLDLQVPPGVISGFVGPNGAGKTTTIRMLLGLVRPTSGSGTVLGEPLDKAERYLHQVGAMIEGPAFTPGLSGADNLRVLAHAGRLPLDRVPVVLDRIGLGSRADDAFRSYSLGMKQRLGIAAALLPVPRLLILDEPTNGLDPAGILQVRDLLQEFREEGMTVLVSSHLLSEVEQVADHLVLVREGRLMFQGPVGDLVSQRPPTITATPQRRSDARRVASLAEELLLGSVLRENGGVVVTLPNLLSEEQSLDLAAELNRRAHTDGIVLSGLELRRPTLEESFLELTGGGSGDVR